MWRLHSAAAKQLPSDRVKLTNRLKPSFAIGLKYEEDSDMFRRMWDLKLNCVPSIDVFAHPDLAVPFLIVESQPAKGNKWMSENKLASATVQAHEILCSLGVDDSVHISGMVYCDSFAHPYISFSLRTSGSDDTPHCSSVILVRLRGFPLDEMEGLLSLLRVIEHVKAYGLGIFRLNVESALARF